VPEQVIRLVGAHEIRMRLGGISRQRVYQLTGRADFPAPVADLAQGKVWLADDVEAWIAGRRRPKQATR
jgi:predicted DNA-binding transcriptional regulator AlpA